MAKVPWSTAPCYMNPAWNPYQLYKWISLFLSHITVHLFPYKCVWHYSAVTANICTSSFAVPQVGTFAAEARKHADALKLTKPQQPPGKETKVKPESSQGKSAMLWTVQACWLAIIWTSVHSHVWTVAFVIMTYGASGLFVLLTLVIDHLWIQYTHDVMRCLSPEQMSRLDQEVREVKMSWQSKCRVSKPSVPSHALFTYVGI